MRTRDRIALLAGVALVPASFAPARAFEGTAQPPTTGVTVPGAVPAQPGAPLPPGMAPASANSRSVDAPPRPPGLIPHAGGASAVGLPATLPRPRAPVPVVATPSAPVERPLPPPTAFAAPSMPIT